MREDATSLTLILAAALVIAIPFALLAHAKGHETGYETGLCTFWVGFDLGHSPAEARLLCEDTSYREDVLDSLSLDTDGATT